MSQDIVHFNYREEKCSHCGVDDSDELYVIDDFDEGRLRFVTCRRCGMIYQNPCPTAESLAEFFSSEGFVSAKDAGADYEKLTGYWDYLADEPFLLKLAEYRLKRIQKITGDKKLRFLKIACGPGTFLHVAKQHGHEALGVDTSTIFCKVARDRYGVEIINTSCETVDLGERRFDVAMIMGALGNLNDDVACIQKLYDHLDEGGLLVMNYPAADSWLIRFQGKNNFNYRPPTLRMFAAKTLEKVVEKIGFEVVEHTYDVQYSNLTKVLQFSRIPLLWKLFSWLPTNDIIFKLIVPGNKFIVCRKPKVG